MRSRTSYYWLYALTTMLASAYAQGQNLVQNPNFDSDVSHWYAGDNPPLYVFDGTAGSPTPGSLRLTAGPGDVVSECIQISGPGAVDVSAQVRVNSGDAVIAVTLWQDSQCSVYSNYPNFFTLQGPLAIGQWVAYSAKGAPLGANIQSVTIDFGTSGPGTSDLNLDTVWFGYSVDSIFSNNFEGGGL